MAGVVVRVHERSQAAEARRVASDLAHDLGFSASRAGEVAIVATEAATNLVNHAREGQLIISAVDGTAIELLAIDRGPGMNLDRCLEDGYSTGGTVGTGLGAIRRLSRVFDGWSDESGTVLLSRIEGQPVPPRKLIVGAVCLPVSGEAECGDNYTVRHPEDLTAILLVDGLGHGPLAADAARQAVDAFHHMEWRGPASAIEYLHDALRGTRGAAIAVAAFDTVERVIRYSGLGNTAGTILSDRRTQSMVSHNGTAGHNAARVGEFKYEWPEGASVVLHTDGLVSSWSLSRYPAILKRQPSLVSGVLYRDFARGRDDCAVITVRESAT